MKNLFGALFAVQLIGGMLTTAMADSIIVPVPHELQQYGSIKLIGEAGVEQSSTYDIQRCNPESDGSFGYSSCQSFKEGKLNDKTSITTGFYRIGYSHMFSHIFEVTSQVTSYISLKKLQVPQINGKYNFYVFKDLTDPLEQDRFLQSTWLNSKTEKNLYGESYILYCLTENFTKKDWKYLRSLVKFSDDGLVNCHINGIINPTRVWVTDPKDGDFVSVLPGTYGIHFVNEDGITKDTYGIRVP